MHLQPRIMERTLKCQLSNVHLLNSEDTALSWRTGFGKAESTSGFPDSSKDQPLPTHSTGTAQNCSTPHTRALNFREGKSCKIYLKISRIGPELQNPMKGQASKRKWDGGKLVSPVILLLLWTHLGAPLGRRRRNPAAISCQLWHRPHRSFPAHYCWQLETLICSLEVSAQKHFNAIFHAGHPLKEANTV